MVNSKKVVKIKLILKLVDVGYDGLVLLRAYFFSVAYFNFGKA